MEVSGPQHFPHYARPAAMFRIFEGTNPRPTAFMWTETEEVIMGIIILIIIGGVLGWLASLVMRTDGQQGILLNIVVGIVGALLAGFILNPLIGGGNIMNGDYSISSLLVSFLGAVVLLAIVNFFRRGSVR